MSYLNAMVPRRESKYEKGWCVISKNLRTADLYDDSFISCTITEQFVYTRKNETRN